MTITATELKNGLGEYLETVREGGTVVVTKNGHPIARLVPYAPDRMAALAAIVGIAPDLGLPLDGIRTERLSRQ